jgi:hypothetical protein
MTSQISQCDILVSLGPPPKSGTRVLLSISTRDRKSQILGVKRTNKKYMFGPGSGTHLQFGHKVTGSLPRPIEALGEAT